MKTVPYAKEKERHGVLGAMKAGQCEETQRMKRVEREEDAERVTECKSSWAIQVAWSLLPHNHWQFSLKELSSHVA